MEEHTLTTTARENVTSAAEHHRFSFPHRKTQLDTNNPQNTPLITTLIEGPQLILLVFDISLSER